MHHRHQLGYIKVSSISKTCQNSEKYPGDTSTIQAQQCGRIQAKESKPLKFRALAKVVLCDKKPLVWNIY